MDETKKKKVNPIFISLYVLAILMCLTFVVDGALIMNGIAAMPALTAAEVIGLLIVSLGLGMFLLFSTMFGNFTNIENKKKLQAQIDELEKRLGTLENEWTELDELTELD